MAMRETRKVKRADRKGLKRPGRKGLLDKPKEKPQG